MNDDKKGLFFLVAEFILVIVCLTFCFKDRIPSPDPMPTVTPTMSPTMTPTQTPSPSPTPSPTPSLSPSPSPIPVGKAVEKGHTFKPYTGYWAYNLKTSQQYKLQKIAETAWNGIRIVRDPFGQYRYCVALGTYWCGGQPKDIGRCFDVYMDNGYVLHCVLADVKRTEDTKGRKNRYGEINNDLLEFIVDEKVLSAEVKNCGNVSKAGVEFIGGAWQIVVLDYWVKGFGE